MAATGLALLVAAATKAATPKTACRREHVGSSLLAAKRTVDVHFVGLEELDDWGVNASIDIRQNINIRAMNMIVVLILASAASCLESESSLGYWRVKV